MSFVCLCCDKAAAHKHSQGFPSPTTSHNANENCQKTQKYSCIIAFCRRIKGKVPKTVYEANPWVQQMMPHVSSPMLSGNRTVPHCISCMHSSCFSIDIKPSLKKEPYPVPLPDLDVAYFDLESDEDMTPTMHLALKTLLPREPSIILHLHTHSEAIVCST